MLAYETTPLPGGAFQADKMPGHWLLARLGKLVSLCPAWKKWGTAWAVKLSSVILHSRADDVIPFADSEELAKISRATLIEVGNDYRLADPEPLKRMAPM